ncbi:MAG: hypothetical protein JWO36_5087 [Myxococcales bacterium]|nr:hypothetical protein [Myxococcales bacterium]
MIRHAVMLVLMVASCQSTDTSPKPAAQQGSATSRPRPPTPQAPAPPLPNPLPGHRRDVTSIVGSAARAAIGDLDGDGKNELVLVDADRLRIVTPDGRELASTAVHGGIDVLVVADLDHDHRAEVLAGFGMSREHRDAPAQVVLYRLDHGQLHEEVVLAPQTTRAEIVEIVPLVDEKSAMLIAYYEAKYVVRSVIARHPGSTWTTSDVASIPMATSYARGDLDGDGKPDLVVGRVYGDNKGAEGDAFVLAADGKRSAIPTTRGVRSVAIADLDGDGHLDVFLADGWHQNYAQSARGLLTWAHHTEHGFTSELVEDTAGQYSVGRILPATIDGHAAIVTAGNRYVRVFSRDKDRWRGVSIADPARDIAVGDLDGVPGDEILTLGDRSEIIDLHGAL